MLPDFAIPVRLRTLEGRVIARDLPAWSFFNGYPGSLAPPEAIARWREGLLLRAVVAPRLTPELVARMGPAATEVARIYLTTIGWAWGNADRDPIAEPVEAAVPGLPWTPELLRAAIALPPLRLRDTVQRLAEVAGVGPWAVWQWPISQWAWTVRLLSDKGAAGVAAPYPREVHLVQEYQQAHETLAGAEGTRHGA
jgi:hypothetical protein